MIYIVFAMVTFAVIFIIVWNWNFDRQTEKLLMKHQKEWDERRSKLEQKGATDFEIDEAYLQYVEHLKNTRHEIYGACFPRK